MQNMSICKAIIPKLYPVSLSLNAISVINAEKIVANMVFEICPFISSAFPFVSSDISRISFESLYLSLSKFLNESIIQKTP